MLPDDIKDGLLNFRAHVEDALGVIEAWPSQPIWHLDEWAEDLREILAQAEQYDGSACG